MCSVFLLLGSVSVYFEHAILQQEIDYVQHTGASLPFASEVVVINVMLNIFDSILNEPVFLHEVFSISDNADCSFLFFLNTKLSSFVKPSVVVSHQLSFSFCQIASLLSDASSILSECMGSFAEPEELKTLLDSHKDLNQLDDIGELLGIINDLFTKYYTVIIQ